MTKKISDAIKGAFNDIDAEEIILFGSRARKDHEKNSDYDILVITGRNIPAGRKISLYSKFRKRIAQKGIDADVLIKSREEVEYYRDKIGSVVKEALREGVAL